MNRTNIWLLEQPKKGSSFPKSLWVWLMRDFRHSVKQHAFCVCVLKLYNSCNKYHSELHLVNISVHVRLALDDSNRHIPSPECCSAKQWATSSCLVVKILSPLQDNTVSISRFPELSATLSHSCTEQKQISRKMALKVSFSFPPIHRCYFKALLELKLYFLTSLFLVFTPPSPTPQICKECRI